MAIIPKELTLIELCQDLRVTPAWVNKTITELKLQRGGRGKVRLYSREERFIFSNIKMLLACNLTWNQIKEIKESEERLIKELNNFLQLTKKEVSDGKKVTEGKPTVIQFLLHSTFPFPFTYWKEKDNDTIFDLTDYLETLLDNLGLLYRRQLSNEINQFSEQVEQFKTIVNSIYRPFSEEWE